MKRRIFYLVLTVVVLYSAGPLIWQVLTSLKTDHELTRIPPLLPGSPTPTHYISVFEGRMFFRIMLNSIVVSSSTTVLAIMIGSLCVWSGKAEGPLQACYPRFILSASMFLHRDREPLFMMIKAAGLRDTWFALIITYTTFSLPLSVWILTNFLGKSPMKSFVRPG